MSLAGGERGPFRYGWRWGILGLGFIIAFVIAIFANNAAVQPDTSTELLKTIDIDYDDTKIDWSKYQTVDIELRNTVDINKPGTYHLTGTLTDGSINIAAGVSDVRLILDNATIINSSGPAIYCSTAKELVIELVGNNVLQDGLNYTSYDKDVKGAIYSKADLTFQGDGTLNLTANYRDGIVSKDDLKFKEGSYNIIANGDGIRGKDSVYIVDGSFNINAENSAIKTTNLNDYGKGFIVVENGNLNLVAQNKGFNAAKTILIKNGTLNINTHDDAIHSGNLVGITNGNFAIHADDDAIHAAHKLVIEGGDIDIQKSYEGLEAERVVIGGGDLKIYATDDGINAGSDTSSPNYNRTEVKAADADDNCLLTIAGGNIYINAAGDGIDSNGAIYFNGGNVAIDGPTDDGNGALDSGREIVMNGGTVLAVGSSGMAKSLGDQSKVNNLSLFFKEAQPANTLIEILNQSGETIFSHTAAKSFNYLAAGSEQLVQGEFYDLYLNHQKYNTFLLYDTTTTIRDL